MIDLQEVKTAVTPTLVVQRYLGQPLKRINDKLWYKSPFRNERTASFVVSDERGIHDFGSSEHYDIFSFIQKLFGLSFMESLSFLIKDFGLQVDDTYLNREVTRYTYNGTNYRGEAFIDKESGYTLVFQLDI